MANIEHLQFINTPATKVYDALITSEGLASVWTKALKVSPEVGFINEFDFDDDFDTKMKIVELTPPKRIEWLCIASDPQWVGTSVSFELEEKNKKTSVVLRHMNWREVTEFYRFCNYNWAFFLYSLKQYCEEGKGIPYQERKF